MAHKTSLFTVLKSHHLVFADNPDFYIFEIVKVLIICGVAAGTKAAAKLERENRGSEITILTKGKEISYAGCGLPYYVEKLIEQAERQMG